MAIASNFLANTVDPGLSWMQSVLGAKPPASDAARLALTAFAGQETYWRDIDQIGGGDGRGPWQAGRVIIADLLHNLDTAMLMHKCCASLGIAVSVEPIYAAIIGNPKLSVALARLSLWADPFPIPAIGDQAGLWKCYLRVWRPGAPRPDDWPDVYQQSLEAIQNA